jgi:hypothetical protein
MQQIAKIEMNTLQTISDLPAYLITLVWQAKKLTEFSHVHFGVESVGMEREDTN